MLTSLAAINIMDIVQDVRKIQYIKLIPTSSKIKEKILLGIDVQTKHIYNLIEIGKRNKTTLTVNSFKTNQPLSKKSIYFCGK
jgi:hypothetical protein